MENEEKLDIYADAIASGAARAFEESNQRALDEGLEGIKTIEMTLASVLVIWGAFVMAAQFREG